MMRGALSTVFMAILAACIGVGLFAIKHRVKEQESRLAELNREIQTGQENVHILKAEWSYLNDPVRLRQLSEKYLDMKVMAPGQVTSLNALPRDDVSPAFAAKPDKAKDDAAPQAAALPKAAPPPLRQAAQPNPPAAPKTEQVRAPAPAQPPVYSPAPLRQYSPGAPPQQPLPAAGRPVPQRTIVIQSPALSAPAGEMQ